MSEHESDDGMEVEVELPPALVKFTAMLEDDQRRLLRDKAFADPNHLRKFVATTMVERLLQIVKMFGTSMYDIHETGMSNMEQIHRVRRWAAKHLRALGAEVNDGEPFAGVDKDQINVVGQRIYALGSYLSAKYPDDKEGEEKFNALVSAINKLVESLMGDQSVEEDDEEDEEEEEAAPEPGSDPAPEPGDGAAP